MRRRAPVKAANSGRFFTLPCPRQRLDERVAAPLGFVVAWR
jgi:hypothetical protein